MEKSLFMCMFTSCRVVKYVGSYRNPNCPACDRKGIVV